jgi:short-subunit dehydrogenase
VTGASSGIGAALARRLAKRGWRVAATARRLDALEQLRNDGVEAFAADVSDREAMAACAAQIRERLGPIGLAVANAGIYLPMDARAFDADTVRRTFEVNLLGAAHVLENVLPDMSARGQGHVHLVSSATGFGGMPTASAYGASKAALINMAECLKIELERCNVGVSVSTPGFVETPAQDDNAFPKPFMVTPEVAARRIAAGLARGAFEITFPRRFTWGLTALYALPSAWRLPLIRKQTGWAGPGEPLPPRKSDRA